MDRKNTPPQETIPSRRSTRTKTSALAHKFGNAIPINTIADNTLDNEVCLITVQQDKNAEPIGQAGTVQESSTDIEIDTTDKSSYGFKKPVKGQAAQSLALAMHPSQMKHCIHQQKRPHTQRHHRVTRVTN